MSDNGSDAIKIWLSVIFTLFIAGVAVSILMIARQGTNAAAAKISDTTVSLAEGDFTGYSGSIISGDQVIGVIKQFEGKDCVIRVEGTNFIYNTATFDATNATATLNGKLTAYEEAEALANATDKALVGTTYISPSTKYLGIVLRDPNTNAITGLYFKKR